MGECAEFFYYAGGVPAIMEEIKDVLHLDVLTVTGETLGENLADLKANGFYERCQKWLDAANEKYGILLTREDIIRSYDNAIGTDGSVAILKGNLAPEGAVIKRTACPKRCSRPSSGLVLSTAKRTASMRSSTTRWSRAMRCSSGTRGPRDPACPRCSTPLRPSPPIKNWAAPSPSSQTAASPVPPPAR